MEKVQSYDVVVVGGGAAGIAAAVGAAQAGAACLLVERNGSLGGQATNANVASYCGFFTHSNPPQQTCKGVLASRYWSCFMSWGLMTAIGSPLYKNAIVTLDEEALKYALDLLVQRYSGLKVLLHCRMISAQTSPDGSIQSIHCVDDEGTYEFRAKAFVDASGDGNLAHLAGAELRFGDGAGGGYLSTKMMRLDHVGLEAKFAPAVLEEAIQRAKAEGFHRLTKESGIVFRTAPDTAYAILPSVAVPALDAETLTACEMNTRAQCQEYVAAFRKYLPGMEHCRLVSSGYKLGIRDTRHLVGEHILTAEEVLGAVKQPDTIARGAWPCEMHTDINRMADYLWVKDDGYYDIPLRCLKSRSTANLWGAGRLVSADAVAFASVRVMGIGFATGQAAGVAAAFLAAGRGTPVSEIQAELRRQGACI
mgnify:CR=1 FL=1